VDFPAKTSQSQEKGQESKKERGRVFGLKCGVLLAKYDPDLHSLRMCQCSLFGEEQELLQILPKSGIMLNGRLLGQVMWVHGIKEKEFGLLHIPIALFPTPTTQEIEHPNVELTETGRRKHKTNNESHGLNLADTVKLFPTPTAMDSYADKLKSTFDNPTTLAQYIKKQYFPTPMAKEGPGGQIMKLTDAVQISIGKKPKYYKPTEKDKMKYPTPTKSDYKERRKSKNWEGNDLPSKITEIEEAKGNIQPKAGGRLNPTWVEWLMGYPLGWTDLKDSETQ
jgi:hypothetical protein